MGKYIDRIDAPRGGPGVRVLMVVPQYPYPIKGGLERQAHELSKSLTQLGIEVQALSGMINGGQAACEQVEGIEVHRVPWSANKALRFVRAPFDLFRVLLSKRDTFDVVHLHQISWFGLFVILAARLLGKPILTKLPNVGESGIPGLAASRFGTLKIAIFKKSDAVVALSSESLAELRAIGFPPERVLAAPNGIRLSVDTVESHSARPDPDVCRIVFVGRFSEEKLIDDLLHVFKRVMTSASRPVRLELWGSGPLETDLKNLSLRLGIQGSVAFPGQVNDVRERLRNIDVFVLPSREEGNSNAILEAMDAGLPIVSTRVGGTPMLVGPHGARLLAEPRDRDALFARLMELVDDQDLRRQTGQAMRERVRECFDIDRIARIYLAAYLNLANGRRDQVANVSNAAVADA